MRSKAMHVYVLASVTRRLYVGVTNDLVRRVWQHRTGTIPGFTKRYGVTRLVYFESFADPMVAIMNPSWADYAEDWFTNARRADPSLRSG